MKEVLSFSQVALCAFTLFIGQSLFAIKADAPLSAQEIVNKAVERAKAAETESKPEYALVQTTVKEERDSNGQIKDREHKAEEVHLRSGTLVKIDQCADKKSKKDSEGPSRSEFIKLLTPQAMGKYIFSLVSRTTVNGRDAFELTFQPRSKNLPGKELTEKIMNQASGHIWIDAEEFELVRANVHIDSEVPVGGFLGALKRAAFSLERVRLETGLWFEKFYKTDYEARKLMDSKRVITQAEFSNFRRVNRG